MGTTPAKPPSLSLGLGPSPLLEREAELELVEHLLSQAPEGRGSLLLLEGPAGIGKTRLLSAARQRAEALGFDVFRARGGELERDFSHGVVRQLFEPRLARAGEDERARLLGGAARLAAQLFEVADAGEAQADEDASFAILHGLFWLTANLAEHAPALLAVDDLHWCDSPSLRFLSYLTRRLDGLPVVVAAAVRSGEPAVDAALLTDLGSEPLATVLRPAALSLDAVTQLLRTALDTEPVPEFLRAVYTACAGNPLLLSELVHELAAEGIKPSASAAARVRELRPDALSRFVLQRLRRLGPAAEALARAVAILGECEVALASVLAGLGVDVAAAAAAALGRAEILRPHAPLGFVHPVLRTAVYADSSDPERALAHERAAELLATRGAGAQQVATHLLHVPASARVSVVATLREAARRAMAEGAAGAARAYLERALKEPPDAADRGDVLLELGAAELRSGRPAAAVHLEEAHALLQGSPRLGEAGLALAGAFYAEGRPYEAADSMRRTIELLDPSDPALVQRLEAELIQWARFDTRLYPLARERLAGLAGRVREDSFGGRFLLALLASELARAGDSPHEARELVERALAGGLLLDDERWQAYGVAVAVLVTLDELDLALRHYAEWLELARHRRWPLAFALVSSLRALALLRRGDLVEAEADARTALDVTLPLAGKGHAHSFTVTILAEALAERGELADAMRTLDEAGIPDEAEPTFNTARGLDIRARLRIATGEAAQGLSDLLDVGQRLEALGVRNPSYAPWRSHAALALLQQGELDQARHLVSEEVELARHWGAPRPLGAALRAAGLVEGGADGLALLRESADVLAGSQAVLERAKSLTELGAARRRANQRAEARGFLREGLELAERCRAAPVAERAHAELLATGARPRRLVRTGVDSLTPSERRVAQMAASGQTNREIAQALFVTPKTIEMHLSHAYGKLGIQARSQLSRTLGAER